MQSINSSESRSFLRAFQPEIMVIYGTSILTEETIVIPDKYLLNMYTGIVSDYRNGHPDFWAYTRGDLKNFGTTIIHLNEGIDSGDIAFQSKVKATYSDGFWFAKIKNLELAGELILKVLKKFGNRIAPKGQGKEGVGYFRTPKFSDLLSFFIMS